MDAETTDTSTDLVRISDTLWVAEIKIEGDDNVYRSTIPAESKDEAEAKLARIVQEMMQYLTR